LSGGEPLLRKDWPLLAERIRARGMKPYLISNGNAVTEEVVREFKRVGLASVGISFDGTEKTHNYIRQRNDSFAKATNAMRLMHAQGQSFSAISQVSNINIGELDEMRQILIDVGCQVWRIQMTTVTGRMQKDLVLTMDNFPRLIDKMIEFLKWLNLYETHSPSAVNSWSSALDRMARDFDNFSSRVMSKSASMVFAMSPATAVAGSASSGAPGGQGNTISYHNTYQLPPEAARGPLDPERYALAVKNASMREGRSGI